MALILVIGGIVFGLVAYKNGQNANANATATAQANVNATATAQANATATANAALTATAIASTYPFSANQVLNDPLSDNSKNNGWETSQFCKFQGSAYHTVDPQTNTFTSCSAVKTDYTNFTFEVEASLVSGDGLGIVFRGDAAKTQFYRFVIYDDGSYGVYVYVDPTAGNTRTLKTGNLAQTPTLHEHHCGCRARHHHDAVLQSNRGRQFYGQHLYARPDWGGNDRSLEIRRCRL
ncbi:MAG: hypothetical protein E6I32_04045 [Chloroflexi bacterium]|nr:MAG: hypothetical protein E6I32_04045 [Chloroflexota bacterium]